MKGPFNKKIGAAVFALGLVAAAVAVRLALGEVDPARALAAIRQAQGQWWLWPAYFAFYVALTTAFLPAVLLHMAVGAAFGFPRAILINVVTFNLTALLQFGLARRLGRERVAAFLARRGIHALDDLSREHGVVSAILVRFLPIPAVGVAAGLGLSPIRPRDYAVGSLLGALPYIAVYTWFASALVEGAAGAEREARWHVAAATVAMLLLALAGGAIRSRVRRARVR